MGFSQDTAVTADSDFTKYAFEQQAANLLRGSTTFADIHKAAVNILIRDLHGMGKDPALITNVEDFKAELTYWMLARIFEAQARDGNAKAQGKALFYDSKWEEQKRSRTYQTASTTRATRRLPLTGMPAHETRWGSTATTGAVPANFDKYVQRDILGDPLVNPNLP